MFSTGVHHVSLNVTDAAVSIRFYVDTLGMTQRDDRPEFPFGGAWLQCGDQQIHLLEVAEFVPPESQHFALRVTDIDTARDHLLSLDIKVSEPKEQPGICRQCFLRDPTGNLIELNQPV